MTESKRDTQPSVQDVALIVGGGPGHQLELRQAVRGERHACLRRSQESRKGGP